MSIFSKIYDVFSRRNQQASALAHEIPSSFRNKIFYWCREVFEKDYYTANVSFETFFQEIHRSLVYRHGRLRFSQDSVTLTEDVLTYLSNCPGEQFLDFIEDIFRVECLFHASKPENQMVDELNELFQYNNLPYYITEFITEEVKDVIFGGQEHTAIKTKHFPKVIMKESEVVHEMAIKPTLELLQRPDFKSANDEFLEALEDYRKGDYGDCLTKCNSAFESVMKILCDKNKWSYNQSDTANKLVKVVLDNTTLESYFESPLILIATIRNKLSKSHGAGTSSRNVPQHIARYAINVTASSILLLAEEANKHKP